MKKFLFALFLILIAISTVRGHPVHVSVINVIVEVDRLKLTVNTFVDDWETAYFHYYGKQINLKDSENFESGWFKDYLNASLHVSTAAGSDTLQLVVDTISFNDLSMHIEIHAKLREKPKSLYIYNAILTDIYADQTNLVIYTSGNKEKGIKFDYHNKKEVLKLR